MYGPYAENSTPYLCWIILGFACFDDASVVLNAISRPRWYGRSEPLVSLCQARSSDAFVPAAFCLQKSRRGILLHLGLLDRHNVRLVNSLSDKTDFHYPTLLYCCD